jgi:quinoprotein glucose dehydrogenase
LPFGFNLGMPNMGGPLVLENGLIFIAAAMDDYLRAFDIETGEELWRGRLPAGGQATPMTYQLNGRQYIIIAAGGHGNLGSTRGDYVVAFALTD